MVLSNLFTSPLHCTQHQAGALFLLLSDFIFLQENEQCISNNDYLNQKLTVCQHASDISVSSESVRQLADQFLIHLNWFSSQTRRLLLVQDLVDSLKLAAAMWVMTYVGAVFNGVTILILADIIFTTPLIYQKKKVGTCLTVGT
ncbi:reticulon-3-B-like isoform X2 [Acanthochromis polyacanthus]|uniref:reticulon-3-B-like isoform X2 n=1 Tax=Acanthochromis polyacanthus TaxID=80966 RepID=UPI002233EE99|nr:reticulon-3-B-like isoform X2 [Acanthochromis polyacanthus]